MMPRSSLWEAIKMATEYQIEMKVGDHWEPIGSPEDSMTQAQIYCIQYLGEKETRVIAVEGR